MPALIVALILFLTNSPNASAQVGFSFWHKPTTVATFTVSKVAVGQNFSCAITTTGVLKCWGSGANGRTGAGNLGNTYGPTVVDSGTTYKTISLSASSGHACGITSSDQLKCWGLNANGQVGNGTTADVNTPTVIDLADSYQAVSAGTSHTCGVTTTGNLKCWGLNTNGRLGDGTTNQSLSPVLIGSSYKSVAAGTAHTCAINTSNKMYCWGNNSTYGALGNNDTADSLVPVAVDTSTNYKLVTVGNSNSCGVTTANLLRCWGQGALGDGTTNYSRVAKAIMSPTTISNVSISGYTFMATISCAVVSTTGVLRCWGSNSEYRLGDGTSTDRTSFVVVDSGVAYREVSMGSTHACGITSAGTVKCWGKSDAGQMGDPYIAGTTSPTAVNTAVTFTKITASQGANLTFAIDSSSKLYGWGGSYPGVGTGNSSDSFNGPYWIDTANLFSSVSSSGGTNCALRTTSKLRCWGINQYGGGSNNYSPQNVDGTANYLAVDNGYNHVCGVLTSGAAKCWGGNSFGELGDGTTTDRNSPTAVTGGNLYSAISTGTYFSCAIHSGTSQLYCWGQNNYGQLATGNTTNVSAPTLADAGRTYTAIDLGDDFGCGIASGALRCWGYNGNSQLGSGGGNQTSSIVVDSGTNYLMVSAGRRHACGITTGNVLKCWGYNYTGQIGNGTTGLSTAVTVIDAGTQYKWISAGYTHTCGITMADVAKCWGAGDKGQIGAGSSPRTPGPTDSATTY